MNTTEGKIKELENDNTKALSEIDKLNQSINRNIAEINRLKHLLDLEVKEKDLGKRESEMKRIIEGKDLEVEKYREELLSLKDALKDLEKERDEEIEDLQNKIKDLKNTKIKTKKPSKPKPKPKAEPKPKPEPKKEPKPIEKPIYNTTIEKINIPEIKKIEDEAEGLKIEAK